MDSKAARALQLHRYLCRVRVSTQRTGMAPLSDTHGFHEQKPLAR